MLKISSRLRMFRRIAQTGEIIGCIIIIGPGLTSDSSGMPFIIVGLCVLALSFILRLYCRITDKN